MSLLYRYLLQVELLSNRSLSYGPRVYGFACLLNTGRMEKKKKKPTCILKKTDSQSHALCIINIHGGHNFVWNSDCGGIDFLALLIYNGVASYVLLKVGVHWYNHQLGSANGLVQQLFPS